MSGCMGGSGGKGSCGDVMATGVGKTYRENIEALTKYALQKLAEPRADGTLSTRGSKGRLEKLMGELLRPYGLDPVPMNTLRRFDKATDPGTKGFSEGQSADNMARMAISFGIFNPSPYDLSELGQRRRMVNAANAAMVRWLDTPGSFEAWKETPVAKGWPQSMFSKSLVATPQLSIVQSPKPPTESSFDLDGLSYDELVNLAADALNMAQKKRRKSSDVKHLGSNLLAAEIARLEAAGGGDGKAIVAYQMGISQARLDEILDGDVMRQDEREGAARVTGLPVDSFADVTRNA